MGAIIEGPVAPARASQWTATSTPSPSSSEIGAKEILVVETELMEAVYPRLRRLARKHMAGEPRDHTLQATALVHEAYEKLVEQRHKSWENRLHFFAAASELMRRIVVDHARRGKAEKRGGGRPHLTFDDASILMVCRPSLALR